MTRFNKNLLIGEYDYGDSTSTQIKTLLLEAIKEVAPVVLRELKNDVLAKYPKCDTFSQRITILNLTNYPELNAILDEWASNCNLQNEEWFKETALLTLAMWKFTEVENLNWFYPPKAYWVEAMAHEKDLKLILPGWDYAFETRADYRKRIINHLDNYLNEKEKQAQQRGFKKTPEKRKKQHFIWWVEYIVNNKSLREITLEYYDEKDEDKIESLKRHIQREITKVSNLMGFVKPNRKGAPRKK